MQRQNYSEKWKLKGKLRNVVVIEDLFTNSKIGIIHMNLKKYIKCFNDNHTWIVMHNVDYVLCTAM